VIGCDKEVAESSRSIWLDQYRLSDHFTIDMKFRVLTAILFVSLFHVSLINMMNHLNPTSLASGQHQYQELALKASLPKYGSCWMTALSQLSSTCNDLSDVTQSRLALKFANCFLRQSGQQDFPCEDDQDIASCLKNVDNNAFTAYSNFYTHTQNMCYFLKSIEWQEMTDNTVNRLSKSSAKVAQLQEEIVIGQRDSLEYQRQLAENGSILSQAIEASKGSVKDMLNEFRLSTTEQKHMIFEVFDRVNTLQNLVVSEVSWLYTVVFYSSCLLVIYLVTSTKRTSDARLWLFFVLTINFGLERLVIAWSLPEGGEKIDIDFGQELNDKIWLVRNSAILVSTIVLGYIAITFKDINKINNTLLEEIRKQNFDLKRSMEDFQVKSSQAGRNVSKVDTLDGHLPGIFEMLSEETGFIGDEEDVSDADTDSFNSTRTDVTFNPANNSEDESRLESPTSHNPINVAMEALSSSLIHSTKKDPLQQSQPPTPSVGSSRYNLRSRSSLSSANNSLALTESPEEFAKKVKEQLGRSRRNYSKWKMAVGRDFSDDDD